MSAGLKTALLALPFCAAAALSALWRGAGSTSPETVAASPAAASSVASLGTGGEPSAAAPADARHESERPLDVWALRQLCGRPWEAAFDAECSAALERRYRDAVPDATLESSISNPGHFKPVMLGKPVTWGEVFDDTAGAVAAARRAVGRPKCLVPEGGIRIDLRDECAADEMAKLAILRSECETLLRMEDTPEQRHDSWAHDLAKANRTTDQADYQERLDRLALEWFGLAWRLGKCRALPAEAMDVLGPFPRPVTVGSVANNQDDLMKAAARLGSDWALSSVLWYPNSMFPVDDGHFDGVAGERPVLAELLRMRRAEGVERIKHMVVSFQLGQALGVQVHPWGVFRFTGLFTRDDHRAAWRLAAPRLMELGWAIEVDDPAAGARRRIEKAEDLWGDEPWLRWEEEGGRIRLVAAG